MALKRLTWNLRRTRRKLCRKLLVIAQTVHGAFPDQMDAHCPETNIKPTRVGSGLSALVHAVPQVFVVLSNGDPWDQQGLLTCGNRVFPSTLASSE